MLYANSPQELPEWSSRGSEVTTACDDEGTQESRQPITAAGARASTVHASCPAAHTLRMRLQTGRLHLSLIWPQSVTVTIPQ